MRYIISVHQPSDSVPLRVGIRVDGKIGVPWTEGGTDDRTIFVFEIATFADGTKHWFGYSRRNNNFELSKNLYAKIEDVRNGENGLYINGGTNDTVIQSGTTVSVRCCR